jgi:acylphosphatase
MHQVAGANYHPAKSLANGLVAQANSQDWHLAGHAPDKRNQDPGLPGCARPGREHNAIRVKTFDVLNGEFVVATDLDLRPEFPKVLGKVVGERIVVVEDEDHIEVQCSAPRQESSHAAGCAPEAHLQNWPWFIAMVLHFLIQGRVQGVGFRWFVQREASELDLHGWVRNTEEGEVEVVASGSPEELAELRASLRRGPRGSRVDRLIEHYLDESEAAELSSFRIDGAW